MNFALENNSSPVRKKFIPKPVYIYTDGSSRSHSLLKTGGTGFVILEGEQRNKILHGSRKTEYGLNINDLEILAIEDALSVARILGLKNRKIHVYTDSQYCYCKLDPKTYGKHKIDHFKSDFTRLLIFRVRALMYEFSDITIEWIKAHSGNKHNNEADKLARTQTKFNMNHWMKALNFHPIWRRHDQARIAGFYSQVIE